MNKTEVQYTNGEVRTFKKVSVMVSGWVKCYYDENGYEYTTHSPPQEIEAIVGEVNYESPHGRI